MRGSYIGMILATIFLLRKAPRTAPEIAALLGIKPDTAYKYIHAMEAEGLVVREHGIRKGKADVFTWVDP